eukprot:scaffold10237_cov71-Cyclotella_meneghiniana.AAC.9
MDASRSTACASTWEPTATRSNVDASTVETIITTGERKKWKMVDTSDIDTPVIVLDITKKAFAKEVLQESATKQVDRTGEVASVPLVPYGIS